MSNLMDNLKEDVYDVIAQAVRADSEVIVIEDSGFEYRAVPAMIDGKIAIRFRVRRGFAKLNFVVDFEPYRDTLDCNFHVFMRKDRRSIFGDPKGIECQYARIAEAMVFFQDFSDRMKEKSNEA